MKIKIILVKDLKIRIHLNDNVILNYFQYRSYSQFFHNVLGVMLRNYMRKKYIFSIHALILIYLMSCLIKGREQVIISLYIIKIFIIFRI